jgi:hypothetical protein
VYEEGIDVYPAINLPKKWCDFHEIRSGADNG